MSNYLPFQDLFLRVPVLSIEELRNTIKSSSSFLDNVRKSAPLIRAIESVSKTLYNDIINGIENDSTIASSYNYLSRISVRPTPYNLFSGMGYGKISKKSTKVFSLDYHIENRFNLDFLNFLCDSYIMENPDIPQLLYYPNTSIYYFQDQVRYIETSYYMQDRLKQKTGLSSINSNPILLELLQLSRKGLSFEMMSDFIVSKGYSKANADNYLKKAIKSKLFISELIPDIEKGGFLNQVCNTLNKRGHENTVFHKIINEVSKLNTDSHNSFEKEEERKIRDLINWNNRDHTILSKNIVYKHNFSIEKEISSQLLEVLKLLKYFSKGGKNEELKYFKEKFKFRYGNEKVRLVDVLDPETGISYGEKIKIHDKRTKLLDGITFQSKKVEKKETILHQLIKKRLSTPFSCDEINLNIEFCQKIIDSTELDLAGSFSCIVELGIEESGAQLVNFRQFSGISASILTSRYTDFSDQACKFNQKVFRREQSAYNEKMIVELSYVPQSVGADIVARKAEREYVIRYCSSAIKGDESKSIEINDLYLSIEHDKLRLSSKKMDSNILPISSNPYIYSLDSVPIINFLCDFHEEYSPNINLALNTEQYAYELGFIPRIRYQNIILSPKYWGIIVDDISFILKEDNLNKQCNLIREWSKKIGLDEEFYFVEDRGDIYFNLSSDLSLKAFIRSIKNKESFLLKEFFYHSVQSAVCDGENKRYVHELVVSFYKEVDDKS